MVARGVVTGMAAGIVGTAAMTVAERLEQRLTGRRNSTVPRRIAGLAPRARTRAPVNHAMHWGTGMVVGALRGVMSASGLRGPWATLMHSTVRLTADQTLENAAGAGAPPWAWRRRELVVDLLERGVYGAVTGAVSDAITPRPARLVARRVRGRSH